MTSQRVLPNSQRAVFAQYFQRGYKQNPRQMNCSKEPALKKLRMKKPPDSQREPPDHKNYPGQMNDHYRIC